MSVFFGKHAEETLVMVKRHDKSVSTSLCRISKVAVSASDGAKFQTLKICIPLVMIPTQISWPVMMWFLKILIICSANDFFKIIYPSWFKIVVVVMAIVLCCFHWLFYRFQPTPHKLGLPNAMGTCSSPTWIVLELRTSGLDVELVYIFESKQMTRQLYESFRANHTILDYTVLFRIKIWFMNLGKIRSKLFFSGGRLLGTPWGAQEVNNNLAMDRQINTKKVVNEHGKVTITSFECIFSLHCLHLFLLASLFFPCLPGNMFLQEAIQKWPHVFLLFIAYSIIAIIGLIHAIFGGKDMTNLHRSAPSHFEALLGLGAGLCESAAAGAEGDSRSRWMALPQAWTEVWDV